MRTTRWSTLRATLAGATLLLAALAAFAPSRAEARGPMFAGFGLGAHWYLDDCGGCRAHFRPQFEFGFHFSRNDTGFFIAFEAVPTFGDDYIQFFGGIRFGGDIEVWGNRDVAFILRPSGLFGGGYTEFDAPNWDWGFFVLQPAFDLRVAVANRLMHIWLRPVGFDLYFIPEHPSDGRFEFDAGYAFMAGLDFNF